MKNEWLLSFFRTLLTNNGVATYILQDAKDIQEVPLFQYLSLATDKSDQEIFQFINEHLAPCVLHHEVDYFQCHYYGMRLPWTQDSQILIIGPVLNIQLTEGNLLRVMEELNLSISAQTFVRSKFFSIPYEQDLAHLENTIFSFCDEMFGSREAYRLETHSVLPADYATDQFSHLGPYLSEDHNSFIKNVSIEDVYASENQILDCIRKGNPKRLDGFFTEGENMLKSIKQRTPDTMRNLKNTCIILNTLCRKAAEEGGVPPIYIHNISEDFALKIENLSSPTEAGELYHGIVKKYALLVQNRSITEYSQPIQRIITMIDTDLTADLSLHHFAEVLNQNASYLSTLFKKETGEVLTDYVNSKRIEHALFLLNTTDLQIQTIANSCGIYDMSYFGKLFKKYVNMTPSSYRKSIR